jgi:hypothetical protein
VEDGYCAVCFTHSHHTAAFHEDVKARLPEIVRLLKSPKWSVGFSGENVLAKLAEEREL